MAIINGTPGNDSLEGTEADDIFNGSSGNDTLDGNGGTDTADYSSLSEAITLERAGGVNKGSNGNDQILDIERIIGAEGQANAIDGSTGTSGDTSFTINLFSKRLTVNDIPTLGDVTFTVENFTDVIGTSQGDSIAGNNQNNRFSGGSGSDGLNGAGGNDVLTGNNGNDLIIGGLDADTLVGGQDNDIYKYNSISDSTPTSTDLIEFQPGEDRIDLLALDSNLTVAEKQAFDFIGASPFSGSGNGQVRYDAANNLIQAQATGSDQLFEIESSVSFDSLSESDFVL